MQSVFTQSDWICVKNYAYDQKGDLCQHPRVLGCVSTDWKAKRVERIALVITRVKLRKFHIEVPHHRSTSMMGLIPQSTVQPSRLGSYGALGLLRGGFVFVFYRPVLPHVGLVVMLLTPHVPLRIRVLTSRGVSCFLFMMSLRSLCLYRLSPLLSSRYSPCP